MNSYRNRDTGVVITDAVVRDSFSGSLPAAFDQATLDLLNVDPVTETPTPAHTIFQHVVANGVEQDGNGQWQQAWLVVDCIPADAVTIKAAAQEAATAAIKAERDSRKAGGVKLTVDGKDYWFWTDDPSRNQYSLLDSKIRRNAIPLDTVIASWKTMSAEFVPFTPALMYSIMDAGIDKEQALFAMCETHLTAMLAADDPSTYNFGGGWAQTYEEWVVAQAAIPAV